METSASLGSLKTSKTYTDYEFKEESDEVKAPTEKLKPIKILRPADDDDFNPVDPSASGRAIRITVLVLGILVLGSAIIATVYGVHPISPMVHIHGNFSLTLPVVISAPTGVFSLGTLTIMLAFKKVRSSLSISQVFAGAASRAPQYIAARGLIPGMPRLEDSDLEDDIRMDTERKLGLHTSSTVKITTRDGVGLDAVWAPGTQDMTAVEAKELGTVIIVHGNACTLDDMADLGKWYHDKEINVLLVSIRGYGRSDKAKGKYREIGGYRDLEATLKFVAEQGVDKNRVAVHGYSLGGAFAAAAYYFFGAIPILMHTFTTYEEVSAGVVEQIVGKKQWISKVMRGVAAGAFPSGMVEREKARRPEEDEQYFVKAEELVTDGFNTVKKIKGAEPFIFGGIDDDLMKRKGKYFADQLFDSAYENDENKSEKRKDRLVMLEGDHVSFMNFLVDESAQSKLEKFLVDMKILTKKEETTE